MRAFTAMLTVLKSPSTSEIDGVRANYQIKKLLSVEESNSSIVSKTNSTEVA